MRGGLTLRHTRKVLHEGVTRRSYANLIFNRECLQRLGLTQKPYAEPLGIFLESAIRGRCYASLSRRPYTEVLRGAIFQWVMRATSWSYAEALRKGLTRTFF